MIVCCGGISIGLRAAIIACGRRSRAIMAASRPCQGHTTTSKLLIINWLLGLTLTPGFSNFGNLLVH